MITLGIDTCDARGSVAVCREGRVLSTQKHKTSEDYSSWLLPAVKNCLAESAVGLESFDLLSVATGPGSFTGLRVGLTAVKAWSELYQKPIVGVSRLEVMAQTTRQKWEYVAASFDAQRGQVFGGLYRADMNNGWKLIEQEMVIGPEQFADWVDATAGDARVDWVTRDPQLLERCGALQNRLKRGDNLTVCEADLAGGIAALGEERARQGFVTDALHLDANYVRRSDAEIFWKDTVGHGRR